MSTEIVHGERSGTPACKHIFAPGEAHRGVCGEQILYNTGRAAALRAKLEFSAGSIHGGSLARYRHPPAHSESDRGYRANLYGLRG